MDAKTLAMWERLLVNAATLAAVVIVVAAAATFAQQPRQPRSHEQMLPESSDCWEPAVAVGPQGEVYVVAGRRHGQPRDKDYRQQQVIWRSNNRGNTFEPARLISPESDSHYDQRIVVDGKGVIYVTYLDSVPQAAPGSRSRVRLARSHDGGRTFSVQTVTTVRVSDKPELAVSLDGAHVYIVYESSPGPRLVASHDGGATWSEPSVVVPAEGRHFWPESLAVARDGSVWLAVPSMSDADIQQGKQTPVTLHLFRSEDRGLTWRDMEMGSSPRVAGACPHNPTCPVKVPRIALAVDDRNRAHVLYTEGSAPDKPYGLFHRSSSDGGRTWATPKAVSTARRPRSNDTADHDYIIIAASKDNRVCATWVDDRRGALDVFARCSANGGQSWGAETLLSDRADGAAYKSATGFKAFYGHYGGAAIDASGRFHVVWAAGEPGYRTGSVWFNSVDVN